MFIDHKFPCNGCSNRQDSNCIEDCISYKLWAKTYYKDFIKSIDAAEKSIERHYNEALGDHPATYYEPCDESGEPYKKGDLDKKFNKFTE